MLVFALPDTQEFGMAVARGLGVQVAPLEERVFEDGESKIRPLVSVRGEDVFVIQSLHGGPQANPHDKLCKLLFFLSTLRSNGAASITALVPYLAYSRKDRQTKTRDPVTTQYIAQLFEGSGADCVVTLDVHNIVAFQNAFRLRTVHLDTRRLFCEHLVPGLGERPVVVASPDPGGIKRAQLFADMLEKKIGRPVAHAFMEKRRSSGVVSGELLVGEVDGATVLVIDDLISSGGTMARAAVALVQHGAAQVICCAAHGLFTGNAEAALSCPEISRIVTTDSVPPFRLSADFTARRIECVSAAPLFAGCIRSLSGGEPTSRLLGDET